MERIDSNATSDGESTAEGSVTNLIQLTPAVAIQVVYYVIGVTGIIGNGFVIFIMFKTPTMHNVTNYLITNQSIVDLIASFIFMMSYAVFVEPDSSVRSEHRFFAQLNCKFWRSRYLVWSCVRVSAANLVCLTAERYYAVCRATWYRAHVKKHHVFLVATFVWVYGFLYQLPMLLSHTVHDDGECRLIWGSPFWQSTWAMSLLLTQIVVPLSFMTIVYLKISNALRQRIQPIRPGGLHFSRRTTMARKNVIKTLIIVTSVYAICWTPTITRFASFTLGSGVNFVGNNIRLVFVAMGFCNLAVNPFIYAFNYRQFQRAMLSVLGLDKRRSVAVAGYATEMRRR